MQPPHVDVQGWLFSFGFVSTVGALNSVFSTIKYHRVGCNFLTILRTSPHQVIRNKVFKIKITCSTSWFDLISVGAQARLLPNLERVFSCFQSINAYAILVRFKGGIIAPEQDAYVYEFPRLPRGCRLTARFNFKDEVEHDVTFTWCLFPSLFGDSRRLKSPLAYAFTTN